MNKVFNFNAGPSVIPQQVTDAVVAALRDFNGTGLSLLAISHRSEEWEAVMNECRALWRELLNIPDTHEILFLSGGASLQFLMVPMNLLEKGSAYLETGTRSKKAIKEAKGIGNTVCVASSADRNYSYIPKNFDIPTDVDYFHITTNDAICGTEIRYDIDSPVTLVADMSSDILSRPVNVAKYGIIYAGTQNNVSPTGVTTVIIRKDILGKVTRYVPTLLNYQTHINNGSLFNTPPVFAIFTMVETLKWLKRQGGMEAINKINIEKADKLYAEIDRNTMFEGTAVREDRSIMSVCFAMAPGRESLQDTFLKFAGNRGIIGIRGHHSMGGFRASICNACPMEAVDALIACMMEFERNNGSESLK